MVCTLMIHTDDRPELDDPDEFYAQDLVGLEVRICVSAHRLFQA